tara:strand:+ start:266 stop:472 length:207 start_codon:yes stop_codon:yes gene_type:complete
MEMKEVEKLGDVSRTIKDTLWAVENNRNEIPVGALEDCRVQLSKIIYKYLQADELDSAKAYKFMALQK